MKESWGWVCHINNHYSKPPFKPESWNNLSLVVVPQVELNRSPEVISKLTPEYCLWLVGFADAEGNFQLSNRGGRFTFSFRIKLHQDDAGVLLAIKDRLGVGEVYPAFNKWKRYFEYSVQSTKELIEVVLPIFDTFPLLTVKAIQYKYWREAIEIKKNRGVYSGLSSQEAEAIRVLKYRMENKDSQEVANWNSNNINNGVVTGPWLIGFTEGDGSFTLANRKPGLYISQSPISESTLLLILNYFKALYSNKQLTLDHGDIPVFPYDTPSQKSNMTAAYISISHMDVLFYYILPFYVNQRFYSRKEVDFRLWIVVLLLFYRGVQDTPTSQFVISSIFNNINNRRYSTYIKSEEELFWDINLDDIDNSLTLSVDKTEVQGSVSAQLEGNKRPKVRGVDRSAKPLYLFKNNKFISKFPTIQSCLAYLQKEAGYPHSRITFSNNKNSFMEWNGYSWFTNLTLLVHRGYEYPRELMAESIPRGRSYYNSTFTWITKNGVVVPESPFVSLAAGHSFLRDKGYPFVESTFIKNKNDKSKWTDSNKNIWKGFTKNPNPQD